MNGKLFGALLILSGGFWACFYQCRSVRTEICLLQELTAALESMETAIRWQKIPLPRTIMQQSDRPLCGETFANILKDMESGFTLQKSWIKEFRRNISADIAEILCRIELQGDEEQITGNLRAAIQGLVHLRQEKEARRREREKLYMAVVLSGAGLAIIVLI